MGGARKRGDGADLPRCRELLAELPDIKVCGELLGSNALPEDAELAAEFLRTLLRTPPAASHAAATARFCGRVLHLQPDCVCDALKVLATVVTDHPGQIDAVSVKPAARWLNPPRGSNLR